MDITETQVEIDVVEVRGERIMRSENARKNRKVVRDIQEKRMRKIENETRLLEEKHDAKVMAKKLKREKQQNAE